MEMWEKEDILCDALVMRAGLTSDEANLIVSFATSSYGDNDDTLDHVHHYFIGGDFDPDEYSDLWE